MIKEPHLRSAKEMSSVLPFFKNINTFKLLQITDNDLHKLIQQIGFSYHPKGNIIFEKGDEGDFFYVLVKGQVQQFLPNP